MQKKTSRTLITVALVFLLPVILAKIVLMQGWYSTQTTNHGILVESNLSYRDLSLTNPTNSAWQVIYVLPADCDALCSEQLKLMQQSYTALGREQDRVQNVVVIERGSESSQLYDLKRETEYKIIEMTAEMIHKLGGKRLLIADPLGNFVLHYPLSSNQDERILTQRDLLLDLRKLLKLSKVG